MLSYKIGALCFVTGYFFRYSELNPNQWTPEDVVSQEHTTFNISDVSTIPTSKEAAMVGQTSHVCEPKVNDQQCCCSVQFIRPFQSSTLCQFSVDCQKILKSKQCGFEDVQCCEIQKTSSSISIKDFGRSLLESDRAEADFSDLCGECDSAPPLSKMVKRQSDFNLLVWPSEDPQASLAVIEDDPDVAENSIFYQGSFEPRISEVHHGQENDPLVSTMEKDFIFCKSNTEENTKHTFNDVCFENIPFIDNNVGSFEPLLPSAGYSMIRPFHFNAPKNIMTPSMSTSGRVYLACDSPDMTFKYCRSSVTPDNDNVIGANVHLTSEMKFSTFGPLPADLSQQSHEHDGQCPLTPDSFDSENQFNSFSNWIFNDPIQRMSSPESVMSISDYRAMSPDSPQAEKRFHKNVYSIWDDSQEPYLSFDQYNSPEFRTDLDENKSSFPPDAQTPVYIHSTVHDPKTKEELGLNELVDLPFQSTCPEQEEFSSNVVPNINSCVSAESNRPFSPMSQSSQCSFSFLELLLSEPIRTKLKSQYCDFYLLYSGENPPTSLVSPSDNTNYGQEKFSATNSFLQADVKKVDRMCWSTEPEESQITPQSLTQGNESSQSFINYWFSKSSPCHEASEPGSSINAMKEGHTRQNNNSLNFVKIAEPCESDISLVPESPNKFVIEDSERSQLTKPIVYNFVNRPSYNLTFLNDVKSIPNQNDSLNEGKQTSADRAKQTTVAVLESPVLSAARPLTYADVVRGVRSENHADAPQTQSSFCPKELVCADNDYSDNLFDHTRLESPQSVLTEFDLSDIEYSSYCLEDLFDNNRADTPDSFSSQIDISHAIVSVPNSPAGEFFSHGGNLSAESVKNKSNVFVDNVTTLTMCEKDSFSVHVSEQIQPKRIPVPGCHSFISHVYDPMYNGPWLDTQQQKHLVPSSFSSIFSHWSPDDFRGSDATPVSSDSTGNFSSFSQSDSGISRTETAETRSTGLLEHPFDGGCNKSPSVSEANLTSPDRLDRNDVNYLFSSCSSTEDRPPSPDSNASFGEFTALTPDSQIPSFDSQPYVYLTDSSSVHLKEDPSSHFDAYLSENRPDSPESLMFDSPKSYSNIACDDTQSFLDHWLAELKPSDPQNVESVGNLGEDVTEGSNSSDSTVQHKRVSAGPLGCM